MYNEQTLAIMKGDPTKPPIPTDNSTAFANWAGTTDSKAMAKDLINRGLLNADQLYFDNPNMSDANSVKNSQGDWKIAAIQSMLARAFKKGIRTPEAFINNKEYLMGGLAPRIKDAMASSTFNQIHPNFWQVVSDSILPDRWKEWDAQQKSQNQTAKK